MSGAGLAGAALLGVVGCAGGMKRNFLIAPLLIGVIVGPIAEQNYRRAMIQTGGSFEWALEPLTLTTTTAGCALACRFAVNGQGYFVLTEENISPPCARIVTAANSRKAG